MFDAANYENETFDGVELTHDLEGIEFYNCVFKNSSFQSTRLVECSFDGCEFLRCNLSLMEIVHTAFLDALFTDCKMLGVNWSAVGGFLSASYTGCILNNNNFSDMNLTRFRFTGCSFHEASFHNTKLAHAVFDDCDLSQCRFSQSDLSHADFTTARNYFMNATTNKLHKARYSLPEAASLLANLEIVLK